MDFIKDLKNPLFLKIYLISYIMTDQVDEIFYVSHSAFRLILHICFLLFLCFLSLITALIVSQIILQSDLVGWSMVKSIIIFLVAIKVIWKYLRGYFKRTPILVINHHGYGGVGFKTWNNYNWAPETKLGITKSMFSSSVSIFTLKFKAKSLREIQEASQHVSVPVFLSDKSVKEIHEAYKHFNPYEI